MKKGLQFQIVSFGRYSEWNRDSREIPKILEFTTTIQAEPGNEFGFVLNIKKGKGERLDFVIHHPDFIDEASGKIAASFEGQYFINSNDFDFYIGDCVWEPVEDKTGSWHIEVFHAGKKVAEKTFEVIL